MLQERFDLLASKYRRYPEAAAAHFIGELFGFLSNSLIRRLKSFLGVK